MRDGNITGGGGGGGGSVRHFHIQTSMVSKIIAKNRFQHVPIVPVPIVQLLAS